MWLLRMAWLNLWRNKGRTLISMAAVFFAVILSVMLTSIQTGAFDHLIDNLVGYYTGYVQVHKSGYREEQTLENTFAASAALEDSILRVAQVSHVTPRLEAFSLAAVGDRTKGVLVVGIDPLRENEATSLEGKLISGHYANPGSDKVMLGETLAKRLKISVNDTIILIGQGYHGATAAGRYVAGGILHFGSPQLNEQVLFMPLSTAQELFGTGERLSSYVLTLRNNDELDQAASTLRNSLSSSLEVVTWEEMMPDIQQHMESDKGNSKIFMGILYLLVAMGIFGTMLMMMVERGYELGMLMAIGMQKSSMAGLLIMESVLTVMGGCLSGILISIPLVHYFHRYPIRFKGELGNSWERFGFEAVIPASTDAEHFISQGIMVLAIGLLLSAYPVVKVLRMNPVDSMKR